jgi:hypothetical protein
MGVIKLGGGVTDIRGSIGGTVFSRGPAGAYARQRVKAVNPATTRQNVVRSRVSALSQYWSGSLTTAQRADWNAYASATSFLNKVGDAIFISGLACFMRLNTLLMQMGHAIQAPAPLLTGQAAKCVYPCGAVVATTQVQIGEPTAGFTKTDPLEFLVVFAGFPLSAGRTQSPFGFRYIGHIQGNAVPPVFAQSFTWPYPAVVGQHYPLSVTHIDLASRVSAPSDNLADVIAS